MLDIKTTGIVCNVGNYTLTRTKKGWRIEGYEWHGEQDASREFAHHHVRVRAETLSECLSRFIDRASAIGSKDEEGHNCRRVAGLSRKEATALAAEIESAAEVVEEIENGDQQPDTDVSVNCRNGIFRWTLTVKWDSGHSMVSATTSNPSPDLKTLAIQWRTQIKCPPVIAKAIDWDSIDIPDAKNAALAAAIYEKGKIVRNSDGAVVSVEKSETTWIPGHPSFGSGRSIGHTRYLIGGIWYSFDDAVKSHRPVTA